jgi:hypothetical protein
MGGNMLTVLRQRDAADNLETMLPEGEELLYHCLWVAELYTPSTLAPLLDGVRKLWEKSPRALTREGSGRRRS